MNYRGIFNNRINNYKTKALEKANLLKEGITRFVKKHLPTLLKKYITIIIIVIVIGFCILNPVQETDIELYLETTEIELRLGKEQDLTKDLKLESIELNNVNFDKKVSTLKKLDEPEDDNYTQNFEFTPIPRFKRNFPLHLKSIKAKANSILVIKTTDDLNRYILNTNPTGGNFEVWMKDSIEANSSKKKQRLFVPNNSNVLLKCDSTGSITLKTSENFSKIFPYDIDIKGIKLITFSENEGFKNNKTRTISVIKSGKIYYSELKDKEVKLRPNQLIELKGAKGKIRFLDSDNGNLNILFTGSVKGISSGVDKNLINLMPTYLQSLLETWFFKDLLAVIAAVLTLIALIKVIIKKE